MKVRFTNSIYILKQYIKEFFSHLPYKLQRILVFPYAYMYMYSKYKLDKELLKNIEIEDSLENSFIKFKKLIEYSYEHVPYYRNIWKKMGISPEDIKSYDDIEKLPVIDKNTVIEYYNEFISDEVDINKLTKHSTGGSSGLRLIVLYDESTIKARRLGILRWMTAAKLKYSDKGVWIGRASKELLNNKKKWGNQGEKFYGFFNPVSNRLQLTTNNMSLNILKHYVKNIKKFKPVYIQGYASGIVMLARYMSENNISIKLKAVLASSETLSEKDRAIIKKVFKCEVFDRYGCGEEVVSASECQYHNGYHIEIDRCLVEILDDKNKRIEDRVGNIIATNLINFSFPLIRYKTGDLGLIKIKKCECGIYVPTITSLVGRNSEYLMSSNFIKETSAMVSQNIEMPRQVLIYQIEQIKMDEFIIRYCSKNNIDLSFEITKEIKKFTEKILYIKNPKIVVERCLHIPVSKNGKMKYLISHIN